MVSELIKKIQTVFKGLKGIDAIVLINSPGADPNFFYITGYTSGLFENDVLIITKNGATHLTSMLEYDTAKSQEKEGLSVVRIKDRKSAEQIIKKFVSGKNLGLDAEFIPFALYNRFNVKYKPKKIIDVSGAFSKARMIKDNDEIRKIRKAVSITKWSMLEIQKHFAEGMTEKDLAASFDYIMARMGAQKPAFDTIVCFGKNAALPHHMPDDTKLQKGDFILIDAGAKVDNYCGDLTRMFAFGEVSKGMQEMYDTVKEARMRALKAIKPGAKAKNIHKIAEDYINKAAKGRYKGKFIHSLGHSLGIEVHDGQGFSSNSELVLKPGMIITVEPGIYIVGHGGIRIEDDVLVTKEGHVVL